MAGEYQDPRWQRLRLEIMQRDGFACVACGDDRSTLHVHHMEYHGDLWNTPPGELQTLCESCHAALGKHPKAGIAWMRFKDGTPFIIILHCPGCRGRWLDEEDGHLTCIHCEWVFEITTEVLFSKCGYSAGKAVGP